VYCHGKKGKDSHYLFFYWFFTLDKIDFLMEVVITIDYKSSLSFSEDADKSDSKAGIMGSVQRQKKEFLHTPYKSYLLRMWQENIDGDWRVVLQDISTEESQGFSSLEAMFTFLAVQHTSERKAFGV